MIKIIVRVALLLSLFLLTHSLYHIGYAEYYMYRASQTFEKQQEQIKAKLEKPIVKRKQEPGNLVYEKAVVKQEPTNKDIFLTIPKLDKTLSVVEGIDKKSLQKGVGHYPTSVMPNQNGVSILAGHRDTVFRNLDSLKLGDSVVINTNNMDTFYTITERKIVSKDYLMPVTKETKPVLILITCYPMHFIGDAPNRLILTAEKTLSSNEVTVKQQRN